MKENRFFILHLFQIQIVIQTNLVIIILWPQVTMYIYFYFFNTILLRFVEPKKWSIIFYFFFHLIRSFP